MANIITLGFTSLPFSSGKLEEGKSTKDTSSRPDFTQLSFIREKIAKDKLANAMPSSPQKQARRAVRLLTAEEPNYLQYDARKVEKFARGQWPSIKGVKRDAASFANAIAGAKNSDELKTIIQNMQEEVIFLNKRMRGDSKERVSMKPLNEEFEELLENAQDKLHGMENSGEKEARLPRSTQVNSGPPPPFGAHSSTVSSQLSSPQTAQNLTIPLESNIEKFQAHNGLIPPSANVKKPAAEWARTVKLGRHFSSNEQARLLFRPDMDISEYYNAIQSQKDDYRPLISRKVYGINMPSVRNLHLFLSATRKNYSKTEMLEKISNRSQAMSAEQHKSLSHVTKNSEDTPVVKNLLQNKELMELVKSALPLIDNLKGISFYNDSDQALIETIPDCCRDQFSAIVNLNNAILCGRQFGLAAVAIVLLASTWLPGIVATIDEWNLAAIDDVNIHVHHWFKDNRIKVRNELGAAIAQILVDLLLRLNKNIQEDIENENNDHHEKHSDGRHKEQNQNEADEQQKDEEESLKKAILKKLAKLKASVQKIIEIQWQDPRATADKLEKVSREMSTLLPDDKRSLLSKKIIDSFEEVQTQLLELIDLMQAAAADRGFHLVQTDPSIGAATTAQL